MSTIILHNRLFFADNREARRGFRCVSRMCVQYQGDINVKFVLDGVSVWSFTVARDGL